VLPPLPLVPAVLPPVPLPAFPPPPSLPPDVEPQPVPIPTANAATKRIRGSRMVTGLSKSRTKRNTASQAAVKAGALRNLTVALHTLSVSQYVPSGNT
jgi:hypothetical protein